LIGRLSSVCIYCGSRRGEGDAFQEAAQMFGRGLAERGVRVVYGGGSVGLMGVVADAALGAGGRVTGVIPRFLVSDEVAHAGVSEMLVVNSMHERKHRMFELADAFVALPGGFGTLDEVLEMITWRQLGRHTKPIIFVSVDGFFEPLLEHFHAARRLGFVPEGLDELYRVVHSVEEALDLIDALAPPRTSG
jgi:uncharacterized protein (TIGR00730 family)